MNLPAPPPSPPEPAELSERAPLVANLRVLSLLWYIPFAGALFVVLVGLFVPSPQASLVFRIEVACVEFLGFVGTMLAARAFERGDYLRSAWTFQAICFAFIFFSDLTRFPLIGQLEETGTLRSVLSIIGNAAAVFGSWRFGRAWGEAAFPDAERTRRRAYIAATVIALVLAGGPLVSDLRALLAWGDREALTNLASEIGDMGSMCLLAPVLPTALALRGGKLAWPWSLLAASLVAWLAFDCAVAFAGGANVDDNILGRTLVEVFRAFGSLFTLSAGLAQRHVIRLTRG